MKVRLSADVLKKLNKIKINDPILEKKIIKKLTLFSTNPEHPSLRLHKLKGQLKNMWSISITKNVRMVYLDEDDEAYFVNIGTHDEVYQRQ